MNVVNLIEYCSNFVRRIKCVGELPWCPMKSRHRKGKCFTYFLVCHTAALKRRHVQPLHGRSLDELMNGPIREKLGIIPKNVTWGGKHTLVNK